VHHDCAAECSGYSKGDQTISAPAAPSGQGPAVVAIPRSIHDVDNGKILGFGAELAEDHPVSCCSSRQQSAEDQSFWVFSCSWLQEPLGLQHLQVLRGPLPLGLVYLEAVQAC
jgi:hypothetical protein